MGELPSRPLQKTTLSNNSVASCSKFPPVVVSATIAGLGIPGLDLQEEGARAPGSPAAAVAGDPPPPPLPVACARHRRGGGWSLTNPCQECLDLAMLADIYSALSEIFFAHALESEELSMQPR